MPAEGSSQGQLPGAEADRSRCSSCDAPVIWAKTPDGKWHPLNKTRRQTIARLAKLKPGERADTPLQISEFVSGYVSHFATCPNADRHRKPREEKQAAPESEE